MLIDDKIEESLHLDYEEIPSKCVSYEGLANHISGFLNTAGGIIIFGLSEQNNTYPHNFTWTKIKKETVENNLFAKVQPWDEGIRIVPIKNPEDANLRIFMIYVPKSKNPPHMANYRYFMRLNFQTKPLEHEQVSGFFRQNYLMKSNLTKSVYGPIYNELALYYNQDKIKKWNIAELERILRENRFLLTQDDDFDLQIDSFLVRVKKWNKALDVVPFRLTTIINSVASKFFNEMLYDRHTESAVRLKIKSESGQIEPTIDRAVLNNQNPIEYYERTHAPAKILDIVACLEVVNPHLSRGEFLTHDINKEKFQEFILELEKEADKDDLISFIRKEFEAMQGLIETYFFEVLEERMN